MLNTKGCLTPVILFLSVGISLNGQKSLNAFRLNDPIIIDGIHEPIKWTGAQAATDFIQMEPERGKSESFKTITYLGFDDEYIYISAMLYQDYRMIAKVNTRDALSKNDDCFAFIIDPYNDNRTGYGFWINPLGTQTDFRINDDGRSIDTNWDTEWKSAVRMENGRSTPMLL